MRSPSERCFNQTFFFLFFGFPFLPLLFCVTLFADFSQAFKPAFSIFFSLEVVVGGGLGAAREVGQGEVGEFGG